MEKGYLTQLAQVTQIGSSARDIRDTYKAYEEHAIRNDPMVKHYEKLEIKTKELQKLADPFGIYKR